MSLRLKTILGIAVIEAVLLALLLTLTLSYLETTNFDGLTKRGDSTAKLFGSTVKDAVLSWDFASLEAYTSELMTNADIVYVRVIDNEGRPLSTRGPDEFVNNYHKPEQSAEFVTDGIYDVSYTIQESGIRYGLVQIGFDMSSLNRQINQAKKWSSLIVAGEMALVALFSYVLGAYLTRRLTHLEKATQQIASGRRDISLAEHGHDEVANVAKAFNNMVTKLSKSERASISYQKQLELMNASLESKVKERTHELRAKNVHLEQVNIQLKDAQAKLIQSEKLAAIGTLASGYAHEINSPLATINSNLQSATQYLADYQNLTSEIKLKLAQPTTEVQDIVPLLNNEDFTYLQQDFVECLEESQQNATRIKSIVAGLKNYSHFENSTMSHDVNVNELVALAVKESELTLNADLNLNITFGTVPALTANPTELQQAIVYIIKNSYLATKDKPNSKIEITTSQSKNVVSLEIKDTGCGMNSAELSRVFDPFYTTRTFGDGSGLGLTSARNIVENHNGEIKIESTEDIGTTVTFSIPAETDLELAFRSES
ncbi:sensor histidine kinase [Vibrio tapetis]|uniref:histidine kinase n=1 Tax=Vibrio tapetis subsp. tapetis TaxID=1671868 RepID=A0A2N8ZMQ2_9VIBR|nr:ATP-binding protein [Vibrio tapetis]SON53204.1 putative Signal transduction histidine kinase [Vibrio tapetis subsp. tapetis]